MVFIPILGTSLPLIIFGIFMGALFLVLLVATPLVLLLYQAYNKIKYVFFPSCQPPMNIEVSSDFSVITQLLCRKMNFKYNGKKMFICYGSARVHFRGFISGLQSLVSLSLAQVLLSRDPVLEWKGNTQVCIETSIPGFSFHSCVASSGSNP